jgi:ATP-dependent DNA helicase HFM1/MER3
MESSDNLVVSGTYFIVSTSINRDNCGPAPTGGGKTVLFELALIQMVMSSGGNLTAKKCIYMAPTKVRIS